MNIKNPDNKAQTNIVFYINGGEVKKEIDLIEATNSDSLIGHNKPIPVYFDGKFGFFKNSTYTSKSVLDKYEYIICQLGKKLNVKMAETYKVYSGNNFAGIISESIFDPKTEKMYLANNISELIQNPDTELRNYLKTIKKLALDNDRVFHRDNGDVWHIPNIEDDNSIDVVLEAFPNIIGFLEPNLDRQNEIIHDYYNMIMLDIITNNVDRNNNNYGLVLDENNSIRFAHLFDNSTITIPGLPSNKRRVNGFMIDRDKLLKSLFQNHYNDIGDISKFCSENKTELLDYLRTICNSNLELDESNNFLSQTSQNILSICSFQKKKEDNLLEVDYDKIGETNR